MRHINKLGDGCRGWHLRHLQLGCWQWLKRLRIEDIHRIRFASRNEGNTHVGHESDAVRRAGPGISDTVLAFRSLGSMRS